MLVNESNVNQLCCLSARGACKFDAVRHHPPGTGRHRPHPVARIHRLRREICRIGVPVFPGPAWSPRELVGDATLMLSAVLLRAGSEPPLLTSPDCPVFVDGLLPPGEWPATWRDVVVAFGFSGSRELLLAGCRRALVSLQGAGCRRAWIDGSFVTNKAHPGDVDGCYDPVGVEVSRLHSALRDLSPGRPAQKAEFGCEFFPNIVESGSGLFFVEFFQTDRDGRRKGIVAIDANDVRVSTLRDYLEALGARLELVAVFDDGDRRVPVHLGKESAAK